ncbi:YkgJ family cysteine cluster protein [Enterococcus sp. AZ081]|uniref:YkgJ family cysteine cluster protein n=1 Tax=Enterococcus sp. AZ081 TaxID=2774816 RepID=UPI003F297078
MERNAKCFCGSGKKTKKCHSTVEPDSKLANIYLDYLSFDKAVVDSGVANACPKGCSNCCNDLFDVSENEFLLILDEILRTGGKSLVNRYKQKALEYEKYLQLNFPNVIKKLDSNMPRNNNVLDLLPYMMRDSDWDRSKSCIFLDDGRCSIYNVRPVVCRKYGTCNTCPISKNKPVDVNSLDEVVNIVYDGRIILKRPYPLFYWFSYFLNGKYEELTLIKLRMIREKSELQYGEFTSLFLG